MEDVPAELARAVEHAFKILDWHEHLLSEEIPPRWMWPLDEELDAWFKEVERKREEKFGSKDKDDPGGDMMVNELAEEFRR
jgi:hypothetical protein